MSSQLGSIVRQIATFFGGTYDPILRVYPEPQIPNLSVVRRSYPKRDDYGLYTFRMPPGTATGCQMVVQPSMTSDRRVALPGIQGRRKVRYFIELNCFIVSSERYVEDTQDWVYDQRDQVYDLIRTDPTLGSGGFEVGAFQVGEGDEDPSINWQMWPPDTDTENDQTKVYTVFSFEAHAFEVG